MGRDNRKEMIEEAEKLYREGWKLKDIAQKIEVPQGTVRRWKCENDWDAGPANKTSERSEKKRTFGREKSRKKTEGRGDYETEEGWAGEAEENSEISEKQRLFCLKFVRCFNATKAYQSAYGCSYEAAMVGGSRLLRNVKIKTEIDRLKKERCAREFLNEDDIFNKYIEIAFADMTDFVEFKGGSVWLKRSDEVDGTLITEVKEGKDGITIKLADRMKALAWLSDHMGITGEEEDTGVVMLAPVLEDEDESNMEAAAETDSDDAETGI